MDERDPKIRRPEIPPEQRSVNVRRQAPSPPLSDGGGDNPYEVDPQQEPTLAPDEADVGPIADRARGEPGLWDHQRLDPDADPDAEPETGDDVETRRKKPAAR